MNQEWEQLIRHLKISSNYPIFIEKLSNAKNKEDLKKAELLLEPCTLKFWNDFIIKNGHIRTSWDISKPSLSESPSQISNLIANFINSKFRKSLCTENRESNSKLKLELYLNKLGANRYISLIELALLNLEKLMRMDEEQHFLSGIIYEPSRKLVLKAEEKFLKNGLLTEQNSIFYLKINEVKNNLLKPTMNLHFLYLKRKFQFNRNIVNPSPMLIPNLLEETKFSEICVNEKILKGIPISPGVAIGPVYFVEHMEDIFSVPDKAILVTTSPNPTFTTIYPLLSGIITVTGGALSHGFIAAREYGIPAISGVKDILNKFVSGMVVKMDGTNGKIEILQ